MNRIKSILTGLIVAIVAVALLWEAFKWTAMRVFVGSDQALVVTNKFGRPLPADLIVVPHDQNEYKGVEQDVRGPGRYFLNPVEYEWQTVPLIDIPAGEPQNWEWTDEGALKDPNRAEDRPGFAQAGQIAGRGVGSCRPGRKRHSDAKSSRPARTRSIRSSRKSQSCPRLLCRRDRSAW